MTQFYIIEIKQFNNGEFEHNVYYSWDENSQKARLKAESKYHEVLSVGAVSDTLKHSAIVVSEECFPVVNQCYNHVVETQEEQSE